MIGKSAPIRFIYRNRHLELIVSSFAALEQLSRPAKQRRLTISDRQTKVIPSTPKRSRPARFLSLPDER